MAVESAPDYPTTAALPSIPGLRFRHFAGPSDYPGINDTANDAREANGVHFQTSIEGLTLFYESLDRAHCDTRRDLVIVEVDGQIVAYGRTEWQDDTEARIHPVVCFVRSAWRGRGIGRALLATLEERAIAAAAENATDRESFLQAETLGDAAADDLLARTGYEAVRHFYVMVRPNLDPLADAPMPDGLEIRPVTEAHLPLIWDASVEASRDTWEFSEPTANAYEFFKTDPITADFSLWRIAWDGDQVAGQVRAFINPDENERLGTKRGWVENILIRRPWRRRGLATALIDSSIAALRERGMTEAALGVDAANESGALRLYRKAGFEIESRETVWRKPLRR
ncbi:MAG TPA: GNAT family N-acetyltransferase [Candidatus Limnocylindrales bacterium]|nr:GNAT family N-acetyltransferase [Candidatus Limnocylindrales bacterium]